MLKVQVDVVSIALFEFHVAVWLCFLNYIVEVWEIYVELSAELEDILTVH
jgi:hypothetical protein